jgi:hypothetical protein
MRVGAAGAHFRSNPDRLDTEPSLPISIHFRIDQPI